MTAVDADDDLFGVEVRTSRLPAFQATWLAPAAVKGPTTPILPPWVSLEPGTAPE
jgi:hypothetical protein